MIYSKSRNSYVVDRYLDGYGGVVTSDGYGVYNRFDPGGMHQDCWAHQLRAVKHLSENTEATGSDTVDADARQQLYADMSWILREAKNPLERAQHPPRLRHSMESMTEAMLARHDDSTNDAELKKMIKRLRRSVPKLFAFLEHPGVDPTNNAAERALRYVVVFRKMSGQIKGGCESMRRMSNFVTCVLTWKKQGKSIVSEVARLI